MKGVCYMAPIWFHLSLYLIVDSHVFLVDIPFDLIYMNSSISKMRLHDNKWIHLISLGYSLLIVICGFGHFDVVCLDVLNDTFSWTSVPSVKLLNVTSSCHITSPCVATWVQLVWRGCSGTSDRGSNPSGARVQWNEGCAESLVGGSNPYEME